MKARSIIFVSVRSVKTHPVSMAIATRTSTLLTSMAGTITSALRRRTQAATAPQLYDTWVTRDRSGARAVKAPPYLRDLGGAAALAAGRPAPVACCWNGVVALDAAPLVAGLRMRCAPTPLAGPMLHRQSNALMDHR